MVNMRRSSSSSSAVTSTRAVRPKTSSKDVSSNDRHVKVAVRCRPMSAKEIKDGHQSIVEFEHEQKVIVNNIGESPSDQLGTRSGERSNLAQVYEFDAVFDWTSSQEVVYNSVCKPIVDGVLEGYNGTIFAYGQTGTGKTYTMEGLGTRTSSRRRVSDIPKSATTITSSGSDKNSIKKAGSESASAGLTTAPTTSQMQIEESRGVIPRAFKHIFDHIADRRGCQFLVRASYMEIYQEEIHDLLRKNQSQQKKLKLHERSDTGVYVKDLTSYVCKSIDEIERVMRVGNQNRKVGATDMNEHSSRSHAIFIITIEQQQQQQQQEAINVKRQPQSSSSATRNKQQDDSSGSNMIRVGRLNLVDLAGSERQRKTNNSGQRHKESIKINLSLSALGNVINSLMKINGQQQQQQQQSNKNVGLSLGGGGNDTFHVPYRDSKLTRLLQDSLGGNSRTLMIANIGPASYNYDETINTLQYASRAKCIQNRPRLNEDPKDALLRQLLNEIQELRSKLASMANDHAIRPSGSTTISSGHSKQATAGNYSNNKAAAVELELVELREKLASLESKLLNGDKNDIMITSLDSHLLEGYTRKQASELETSRAQLMDQADREKVIRDELERREEAELEIKRTYSSVQQEVDAKRALIRQVLVKTKGLRDQLDGSQNTYRLELDELDQLQYVLQKELRLKCLIMDNFIPNHHVNQMMPRIYYDDKRDLCSLEPIDLPLDYCNLGSFSLVQCSNICRQPGDNDDDCDRIRPRSELERISETVNPMDARYKYENVLDLCVQQPSLGEPPRSLLNRQVQTNNQPPPSNKIQTLIEAALNEHEPDIVIH